MIPPPSGNTRCKCFEWRTYGPTDRRTATKTNTQTDAQEDALTDSLQDVSMLFWPGRNTMRGLGSALGIHAAVVCDTQPEQAFRRGLRTPPNQLVAETRRMVWPRW